MEVTAQDCSAIPVINFDVTKSVAKQTGFGKLIAFSGADHAR